MIQLSAYKHLNPTGPTSCLQLTLNINPGARIGIAGPSGAGKTTLLKILAGLITPEAGYLHIDNEVWFSADKAINRPPQQRDIGFVFQNYALFPNMNVRQNLEFAFKTTIDPHRVDAMLQALNIASVAKQKPETLSGGQQQRVALGRALLRNPKLLLLDEPLSALDPTMRTKLQCDLKRALSNFKGTLIIVSHDPAEVIYLADELILLEKGKIAQRGNPAELLLRPKREMVDGEIIDILQDKQLIILKTASGILPVPFPTNETFHLKKGDHISYKINDITIRHRRPDQPASDKRITDSILQP